MREHASSKLGTRDGEGLSPFCLTLTEWQVSLGTTRQDGRAQRKYLGHLEIGVGSFQVGPLK